MNHLPLWKIMHLDLVWAYEGGPRAVHRSFCDGSLYLTAWLVLRGCARVIPDGKQGGTGVEARAGEWLFPGRVPRYQEFDRDTRLLSLAVQARWPDGRALFEHRESLMVPGARFPALARQARLVCRRSASQERVTGYLALQEALYGWVKVLSVVFEVRGILPGPETHGDARTRELLRLLDSCPLDEPCPGDRMARELGLSRVQFERLCTRISGKTSRQYLDRRRLDYARRVLPFKLAKEVAAETGFRHSSTFSAWYRRHTGVSPASHGA